MKKMNLIKLGLDLVMAIVFALLFNKRVIAGLAFHEIAGLALGVAFMVHMALNWKWIKQVSANLFNKRVSPKTRFGYIVDVLLLFLMGYIIVSGLLISRYLIPVSQGEGSAFLKITHISFSYLAILLTGVHVGLHWGWVMNTVKRAFGIAEGRKSLAYLAKLVVVLVFLFGAYNVYSSGYLTRVASVGSVRAEGAHGYGKRPQGVAPDFRGERDFDGAPGNSGDSTELYVGKGGFPAPDGKGLPNTNATGVLFQYLGIGAVFTTVTYYVERFLNKRKIA